MAQKQNSSRAILVITIVIAVVLIVVIWPLSMIGKGSVATGDSDAVYARILPVAKIELAKAPAAAADGQARDGAAIYNSICMACHASGVAGAPKAGDAAAWVDTLQIDGAAPITLRATACDVMASCSNQRASSTTHIGIR